MPFRIALSGLNAASADLRVIGNNVANASTTGFKKSRVEFADIYADSSGSNAIGAGVKVSSVKQEFAQGNIDFTNNNLDMAISGEGFFRLNEGGEVKYSRAGSFGVDRSGFVVNSENQRLTGYVADATGTITGALGDIQISTNDLNPNATTNIDLTANLDSSQSVPTISPFNPLDASTYNNATSLSTFDSLGNSLLQTLYFEKTANSGEWNMYTYVTTPQGTNLPVTPLGQAAGSPTVLQFDPNGGLTSVVPDNGVSGTIAGFDPLSLTASTGAADLNATINMGNVTQYGSEFAVNGLVQDGYTTGRLSGIDVGDTGVVTARYTNGQSLTLAQVAMANFSNLNGLLQLGDTTWAETFDSGSALVGTPGTGTLGGIQSGALEGSNVDLTEQLVNMITAQRNFQANAQVIETADTVTQTIINIR